MTLEVYSSCAKCTAALRSSATFAGVLAAVTFLSVSFCDPRLASRVQPDLWNTDSRVVYACQAGAA